MNPEEDDPMVACESADDSEREERCEVPDEDEEEAACEEAGYGYGV